MRRTSRTSGSGSIMGSLMGTAFMVLLPEVMEALVHAARQSGIAATLGLQTGLPYLKQMAIGLMIILFLIFVNCQSAPDFPRLGQLFQAVVERHFLGQQRLLLFL